MVPLSDCNTLHVMCDITNVAVVCSESIERFPVTAFTFFFKPFISTPVAPIITSDYTFHIPHSLYLYT
jgi:hypothetical protein